MSITRVSAYQAAPSAAVVVSNAASAVSGVGGTLQTALAGQSAGASDPTQTAYRTEPARGVPSGGHRHYHHGNGSMESSLTQTASTHGGTAAGRGPAKTQTSGGLLRGEMMRVLQAYGATVPVG
jgi:hypothetical protein